VSWYVPGVMLESTTTVTNPARGSKPTARVSAALTSTPTQDGGDNEDVRTAGQGDAELVADGCRRARRVPSYILVLAEEKSALERKAHARTRTLPRCQTLSAVGLVIVGTHTDWGFGVATAAAPEARAATAPRNEVIIVAFIAVRVSESCGLR
jgi:hypothetical protein